MSYYVTICSYFISCMCHLYLATSLLYVHALVFLAHIYVDLIVSVTNVFVVFLSTINKHFLLLLLGLAHFTHFSVLISSIEVLPKYIASCSFSEVILVLFSNFNGVD